MTHVNGNGTAPDMASPGIMPGMGRHMIPLNGAITGTDLHDPERRRRARVMPAVRRNWWRLVFATVGAVAAVVSYGHIVSLFLSWDAPRLDAHLMPVAIDGLIIIGAGAARSGQTALGWSAI